MLQQVYRLKKSIADELVNKTVFTNGVYVTL